MAKLTDIEELDRLREQQCRLLGEQAATGTLIRVGMGTCGMAAGARETFVALKAELQQRRINVPVSIVGCVGLCVKEPLVDIQQAGGPRVTYANVTPEMVPHLIEEHLIRGRPVKEWVMACMNH